MKELNQNITLNGKWKFITDAGSELTYDEVEKKYLENDIREMEIPSNWELQGLHNFNGSVWFIKEFTISTPNHLSILKFNGVDYFTDVWLNKKFLGSHEGYFQPFFFDITDYVSEKNLLIVKVTSPLEEPGTVWPHKKKLIKGIFNHHDCRPGGWDLQHGQDKNTGGIWNNVEIHSGFPVYLSNVKISSSLNFEKNSANLSFKFYPFTKQSSINSAAKISITSPAGERINFNFNLNFIDQEMIEVQTEIINPHLWWSYDVGEPALYSIQISSEVFEEQKLLYGIREVKLDENGQFFINNKSLFLRGTNIIPAQFLSDLSAEKIKRITQLIKNANINIVRVHAHVNRKELYEEFDKNGILVWRDFPLQWTYDESKNFYEDAQRQIKEMVNHLYNYSSVAFWCCHNEPGHQIDTLDKQLHKAVESEDQTRIIRTASNYEEHAYDGWYWGNKEHYAAAPMGPLVTEFGAQGIPTLNTLKKFLKDDEIFPPDWKKWSYHNFQPDQTFNIAKIKFHGSTESFIKNSQQYQSDLIKTAVEFYRRKKFKSITGIFQFMLIDCWPSITWSVVDYYENPKQAYYTLQQVYQPLFISVNVRQDQYFTGSKILIDVYIINDLHIKYNDCSLRFMLDDKKIFSLKNINVPADDLIFFDYTKLDLMMKEEISTGRHLMKLKLMNENKVIAENEFEFTVIEFPEQRTRE